VPLAIFLSDSASAVIKQTLVLFSPGSVIPYRGILRGSDWKPVQISCQFCLFSTQFHL